VDLNMISFWFIIWLAQQTRGLFGFH